MQAIPCPLCHSSSGRNVRWLTWVVRLPAPLHVRACMACGLKFLSHEMTPRELQGFYNEEYFAAYAYETTATGRLIDWRRRLEKLAQHVPEQSVIDIGCATGEFLGLAKSVGWSVQGVEASEWAARRAEDLLGGGRIFIGTLDECVEKLRPAGLVHASHVLEHVSDPVRMLTLMRNLLLPGGRVVVEVPNEVAGALTIWNMLRGRPRYPVPGVHHSIYFTRATLRAAFERAGLTAGIKSYSPDYVTSARSPVLTAVKRGFYRLADFAQRGASLEATGWV